LSRSLLKKEGAGPKDDCLECHRDIRRKIDNSRHLHEPIEGGDCSECHTVHKGDPPFTVERFDPRKNVPYDPAAYALCFSCHSAAMIQVRFTESETGFRHRRWNLHNLHVVRDGERGFGCWVCHDSHSSRQPHLLSQETPVNSAYSLKIQYSETQKGGRCRTNCHTVQEYSR
jgi:predicted CXXCH cytochrome family protein